MKSMWKNFAYCTSDFLNKSKCSMFHQPNIWKIKKENKRSTKKKMKNKTVHDSNGVKMDRNIFQQISCLNKWKIDCCDNHVKET